MLPRISRLVAMTGLLAYLAPARADVVYDQPAAPLGGDTVGRALVSTDGPSAASAQVFDNFKLGAGATIGQVGWQGLYADPTTPSNNPAAPNSDAFRITFLSDVKGLPGTPLLVETIPAAQVQTSFAGNALLSGATVPVYDDAALLPTPFSASANTPYWISIVSVSSAATPLWAWTASNNLASDQASLQVDASGTMFLRSGDRALTLGTVIPEPSSFALAGVGLFGLLAYRRSRRDAWTD